MASSCDNSVLAGSEEPINERKEVLRLDKYVRKYQPLLREMVSLEKHLEESSLAFVKTTLNLTEEFLIISSQEQLKLADTAAEFQKFKVLLPCFLKTEILAAQLEDKLTIDWWNKGTQTSKSESPVVDEATESCTQKMQTGAAENLILNILEESARRQLDTEKTSEGEVISTEQAGTDVGLGSLKLGDSEAETVSVGQPSSASLE